MAFLPKDMQGRPRHIENYEATLQGAEPVISEDFLRCNVDFRNGVGRVQEDISEGRFEEQWLEEAIFAHDLRQRDGVDMPGNLKRS